jgi:hypothetical protein
MNSLATCPYCGKPLAKSPHALAALLVVAIVGAALGIVGSTVWPNAACRVA